jgi:hypothetical protein
LVIKRILGIGYLLWITGNYEEYCLTRAGRGF